MKTSHNPVTAYILSAFEEFGKVTWPTKEQAALLTGIVVAVSLIISVFLGVIDLGLSEGYKALLEKVPAVTQDAGTPTATPITTTPSDTDSTSPSSQQ